MWFESLTMSGWELRPFPLILRLSKDGRSTHAAKRRWFESLADPLGLTVSGVWKRSWLERLTMSGV